MTTDELIETLERRRTKSMAFERQFGLEGHIICPDDLDALFVTLSISEASALISALKENKRLREVLVAIESGSFPGATGAALSGQLAPALQGIAREAVEGAEKALATIRNLCANWSNAPDFNPTVTEVHEFANSALATLRAAREGAR